MKIFCTKWDSPTLNQLRHARKKEYTLYETGTFYQKGCWLNFSKVLGFGVWGGVSDLIKAIQNLKGIIWN